MPDLIWFLKGWICVEPAQGASNMPTPHKHAAVIKAWADGAQIQFRRHADAEWLDTSLPEWTAHHHYRVKPEPHEVHVVAWISAQGGFNAMSYTDKAGALGMHAQMANNSFVQTLFPVGTLKFPGD